MGCHHCCKGLVGAGLAAAILLSAACTPETPKVEPVAEKPSAPAPAPAPPVIPDGDPAAATYERAAPPTLQPVVLGKFEPGNPVAVAVTGAVDIEDGKITGSNGASFITERVALVSGDDQYMAGARYADVMMIEPRQQVELRHVVEQTPPSKEPANAFCGSGTPTGYLALAKVMEGETEVVKLIALSGDSLPAPGAQDIKLCAATNYLSTKK